MVAESRSSTLVRRGKKGVKEVGCCSSYGEWMMLDATDGDADRN